MGNPKAMADTNQQRLDRIEVKIDKLADAMISLARTEEKILSMEKEAHNHFERMNRFSNKLDSIEAKVNENAHTVSIINRLAIVVSASLIGALIKMLWF
jgi:phage shock protein A